MAPSIADGNDGRNVMANLAARLMGKTAGSPSQAAPSTPSVPRTMPTPRMAGASASGTPAASPRRGDENVPPHRSAPASSTADDVQMTDVNQGPSLKGMAAQLAAARQLQEDASGGSRRSRENRQRLLSRDSFSSGSTSTRASTASLAASPRRQPIVSAPLARSSRSEVNDSGDHMNALHSRPSIPSLTSPAMAAPSPTQKAAAPSVNGWPTFASNPTTTKSEDKATDDMAKNVKKAESVHAHPSVAPQHKKSDSNPLFAKQLTDVTSTLKESAPAAKTPPHLRARVAAAGIPERIATAATTAMKPGVSEETNSKKFQTVNEPQMKSADAKPIADGTAPEKIWSSKEATTKFELFTAKPVASEGTESKKLQVIKEEEAKPAAATVKTEPLKASAKPFQPEKEPEKTTAAGPAGDRGSIPHILEAVKNELKEVNKRVGVLEEDNFTMQKQLEAVIQAEERRKFLGTDSAKAPFAVEVKSPSGETYSVQVKAELKVYEVIRRIRTKADLGPAANVAPRLAVDGEEVGHGMMLGEVGIVKGNDVAIAFSYGKAD